MLSEGAVPIREGIVDVDEVETVVIAPGTFVSEDNVSVGFSCVP